MKKTMILLILIAISLCMIAQDQPTNQRITRNEYLRKARTQSTFGWVLAGTGAACILVPVIDNATSHSSSKGTFNDVINFDAACYASGAVLIGTSLPLFFAAGRNKEKAATMGAFIKMEKVPMMAFQGNHPRSSIPAIGLRLNIR